MTISLKDIGRDHGLDISFRGGRLTMKPIDRLSVCTQLPWRKSLSVNSSFCRALVGAGYLTWHQMLDAVCRYRLGKCLGDAVIFWQINQEERICDGKVMFYGPDCHRRKEKEYDPTWVSALLLRRQGGKLANDITRHCFFGLHQLSEKLPSFSLPASKNSPYFRGRVGVNSPSNIEGVSRSDGGVSISAPPESSYSLPLTGYSPYLRGRVGVSSPHLNGRVGVNSPSNIEGVSRSDGGVSISAAHDSSYSLPASYSLPLTGYSPYLRGRATSYSPSNIEGVSRSDGGVSVSAAPESSYSLPASYSLPLTGYSPYLRGRATKNSPSNIEGVSRSDGGVPISAPLIAIVESEKTAVILSAYYPQYIWLASGGLGEVQVEKFRPLRGRKIILFPDTDPDGKAYQYWYQAAQTVMAQLFWEGSPPIRVSAILEQHATPDQKRRKIDLVEYLTENKTI